VRVADSENALARFLIAPALIYIGAVIGVPFVLSLWFAVSDVTVSSTAGHFVGLSTSASRWKTLPSAGRCATPSSSPSPRSWW